MTSHSNELSKSDHACLPRLLVSVRSVDEAQSAIAGGAEILDVKEPAAGSLGMASIETISQIAAWIDARDRSVPLSVALGELSDWGSDTMIPSLPQTVTYAKMGLSHCASRTDWREEWTLARSRFDQQRQVPLKWVAVAYADSRDAHSPSATDVLNAAIETDCAGFLFDTWTKDGRCLLDEIDLASLKSISRTCQSAGLFLALAGRLDKAQLARLQEIEIDVVAIRSAACAGSDRTSQVNSDRVHAFHAELATIWPPLRSISV